MDVLPKPGSARVIDAHVHVGGSYPPLADFTAAAVAAGVTGAILVQQVGGFDNTRLADLALAAGPDHWVIAMIDYAAPDAVEQLAAVARLPRVRGVRLWGSTRSPGPDPYLIWREIARLGLVASVRGPVAALITDEFADLLAACPDLIIRFEHVGFFRYGVDPPAAFARLLAYAEHPGTSIMWSGFYAYAREPEPDAEVIARLRDTLDAYGAERLMWSGDWNRNTLDDHVPAGYYCAAQDYLAADRGLVDAEQRAWLLGRSAARYLGVATATVPG